MDQWNRAYFLPVARHGQTGEMSAAVPQSIIDVLRAFQLPGDVYSGNVQRNVPMFDPQGDELDALQTENPEYIKRLSDLASSLTLGSGAIPAEKGALRMGASVKNKADDGIRAYHGSPHDFDRFDLSKIGTGEGAQVYGHGLYFAENEGVARFYRDALSGVNRLAGGSTVKRGSIADRLAAAFDHDGQGGTKGSRSIYDYAKRFAISTDSGPGGEKIFKFKDGSTFIDFDGFWDVSDEAYGKGHMYEVRIKANPDDFLDWDKPLIDQPNIAAKWGYTPEDIAAYRNAISEMDDGLLRQLFGGRIDDFIEMPPKPHGAPDLAQRGAELVRGPASRPSWELKEKFPGIKYLDAQSRYIPSNLPDNPIANEARAFLDMAGGDAQKATRLFNESNPVERFALPERDEIRKVIQAAGRTETRNYVVFDDKLIEIVRKYGIAALVSAGVISQADGEALAAEGYPE